MVSINALLVAMTLSGAGETVLLDFTAQNCVHCRTMEPTVRRIKEAGYPVREIDVNRSPAWAQNFQVRGVPCFVMLSGGKVVDRVEGATSHQRLLRMFEVAKYQAPSPDDTTRAQSPDNRSQGIPLAKLLPPARRNQPTSNATTTKRDAAQSSATEAIAPVGYAQPGVTPEQLARTATVRLKVEDPNGYSFGTGTIIDTHGDEALVLTCGHLFRDSKGKGKITVDLFTEGEPRSVAGQLITYDSERVDLGLVSIRPGIEITPVPVAPTNFKPEQGSKVFSIGCNHGRPPTLMRSTIASINRYKGPPNIQASGAPVTGRSGGGLFSADGMIIGVCNAADEQDNEGIYAALPTIQQKLAEVGLKHVYQQTRQQLSQSSPKRDIALVPLRPDATPFAFPARSPATQPPVKLAGNNGEQVELILLIRRPNDPSGKMETVTIQRPSKVFMSQLNTELRSQATQFTPPKRIMGTIAGAAPWTRNTGPVYRAQSED